MLEPSLFFRSLYFGAPMPDKWLDVACLLNIVENLREGDLIYLVMTEGDPIIGYFDQRNVLTIAMHDDDGDDWLVDLEDIEHISKYIGGQP